MNNPVSFKVEKLPNSSRKILCHDRIMGSFANGLPTKAFSIFMAVLIIAVNIFGVLSYVVAIRSAIKSPAADGIFIVTVILLR